MNFLKNLNNNKIHIKCKIDEKLNEAFKKVLNKQNITGQDLIEKRIKEFVLDNLHLIIEEGKK